MAEPRIAVYSGSFDPVTWGHLDIIERASRLVDKLIVGIGINPEKKALFTPEERLQIVRHVTARFANVEVATFSGLAVSFVRQCGARIMFRGVRPLTDIAAEFTMMMANRRLDPEIETVFLMADANVAHVSSSLIKQIAPLASDELLAKFVPPEVIPWLRQRIGVSASATLP